MLNLRDEKKIVLASILGVVVIWVIDSLLDSFVFQDGPFWRSLRGDLTAHELFFRLLFASSFIVFGIVISAFLKKRRDAEDGLQRAVAAFEDERTRSASVLQNSAVATFVLSPAHKVLIWNRACEKLTGIPATRMINTDDHWRPFYPEKRETLADILIEKNFEALPRLYEAFARSVLVPEGLQAEGWYPNLNGKDRYIMFDAIPIYGSKGDLTFVIETLQDITDRKRAEEALRESESKYKDLVELTTDIIYRSDKNGNQVFMNDAAFRALGYSPDEVIGKPVINLLHPDDRNKTWEKRREMIERGIDVFNFENRYVTKSGTSIDVLHNVRVLRNEKGEIVGTQGIARDITEWKKAEEKLRLFSQAIDEAMDGVQIVDLNGRIMYSNKAVEEIYGFSAAEFLGRHVNDMNADPAFAGRVILPALGEKGRWSGELMVKHKDGREFPIWLSASTVKNDKGEPIAMVGIIRDITSRKQTEYELRAHREHLEELVRERTQELLVANERLRQEFEARRRMEEDLIRVQKLESLSLLAGGIAHDFNNLLASILGNISLAMLDVASEGSAYQQLASAERAALRARELTLQLLTFSRGGAPIKSYISVDQLVRDTADFSLRGSRVRLEFSFPDDLLPVEVDPGQMAQVVNNLIINADQAMPEGGTIAVTGENVSLGPYDMPPLKAGDYIRLTVRDEGIGIPKEYLSKIFDPYFTTKQKGSGLGLAISYSIIQKHDGLISVESEVGVGTTFRIYLPAAAERRSAPRAEKEKLMTGTGRILVLDDEADVRKTTGDILMRLGYTVAFANEGGQAIDLYRKARDTGEPFDVTIMDLTVPGGMGGKEAVRKLLEIDPEAKVIVSSGYSKDPVMSEFAKYGFKGVVAKPFRVKELGEAIHRVMNDRS